jgi:hypothetical protein
MFKILALQTTVPRYAREVPPAKSPCLQGTNVLSADFKLRILLSKSIYYFRKWNTRGICLHGLPSEPSFNVFPARDIYTCGMSNRHEAQNCDSPVTNILFPLYFSQF